MERSLPRVANWVDREGGEEKREGGGGGGVRGKKNVTTVLRHFQARRRISRLTPDAR